MNDFIAGASAMASAAVGLFFLRFWRKSRDRLFAMFAVAFWLLAANRVAFAIWEEPGENRIALYGVRLLAFVLILVAVFDKNRSNASRAPRG